jgi:hypothetical protein
MISPEADLELRYLPFWTLYDYIDNTPPHPFIPVYVVDTYARSAKSPDGPVSYEAANLAIYKPDSDLIATDIPVDMLIRPDQVIEWSKKIADWFTDHALELVSNAGSDDEKS